MFSGLNKTFKLILPKRLFYRSLIIVASPIIILQLIVSIVYFDSIWIKANKGMTRSLVAELKTLHDVYNNNKDNINFLTDSYKNNFDFEIDIQKDKLRLLGINSEKDVNPIVHTVAGLYGIILSNTPKLKTLDTEFTNDDMKNPFWVKISDIHCRKGECYTPNSGLPLRKDTISLLQNAVNTLGLEEDVKQGAKLLSFKARE